MTIPERLAWAKYHAKTAPRSYAIPQSKYRNKRQWVDGIGFSSKLEARCYEWLKLRQAAGEVLWFIRQPRFDLGGNVQYVADFLAVTPYSSAHLSVEVIDAKGYLTAMSKVKIKLLQAKYPFRVMLWTGK